MQTSKDIVIKKPMCMFCWTICGMKAYVDTKKNKVLKIMGDAEHPLTKGFTCDRGLAGIEYNEHPDRLNYPLKRVGERGEGKWTRISWDQALDEIALKLDDIKKKYGAEGLFTTSGTGRYLDDYISKARFMNLFGTPNRVSSCNHCYCNNYIIDTAMAGSPMQVPHLAGFSAPKLIVLIGHNPEESMPLEWVTFKRLRKEFGSKVIVVDPRHTGTVKELSDVWLPIRPASDTALELCWIRFIIEEGLYDTKIVENWTDAPFLVRLDTMKLLRENSLADDGSEENFVVWDKARSQVEIWASEIRSFKDEWASVTPALEGSFEVTLRDGSKILTKTVWTLLKERVAEYTPERTSELTWLPVDKILESAQLIGSTKPMFMAWGLAPDSIGKNSSSFVISRNIIRAITGNIGTAGGHAVAGPHPDVILASDSTYYELLSEEQKRKQIGSDRFKLQSWMGNDLIYKYNRPYWYGKRIMPEIATHLANLPSLYEAILDGKPYPVRAGISSCNNPLSKHPDTSKVFKALMSLDLYVVMDSFMAPHAMLADYVLPATDWLERPVVGLQSFGGSVPYCIGGERAIKPRYERRDDFDFWRGLGIRLGQEKYWPWKTLEEEWGWHVQAILEKKGLKTYDDFVTKIKFDMGKIESERYQKINPQTGKKHGFGTPSGRIEIWSSIIETLGYDPLPIFEEPSPESPFRTPELLKEYPLILLTGSRRFPMYHSEFRQIKSIRAKVPGPIVEIHPSVAKELGIGNDDEVLIETRYGKVKSKAVLTDSVNPKIVSTDHGWWYPEESAPLPNLYKVFEVGINMVTKAAPDDCDPICGSWPLRSAFLCKISKAE